MEITTKVSAAVQSLLGEMAEETARDHPVVLRRRKFTAATLARTFILGFLAKPRASDEELAQTAALCGVDVTAQAVEQRQTMRMAEFLEALFRTAARRVVGSQAALAPLLRRFPAVLVLDSTAATLPDALRGRFPGCGGSHGGGKAAVKLQVQWDLRSGALDAIAVEPGRVCDCKTSLQRAPLARGALRIADLGYFDAEVFRRLGEEGVFWLSRLLFGTSIFAPDGRRRPSLAWLGRQPGPVVDRPILMGAERRVACRIVAWRVPADVADRRRRKLRAEMRRRDGRVPSRERLAWCGWTILVTNVAAGVLSPKEVAVLYRARWQVELLFKRWKSLGSIAERSGSTPERRMVRLWSRLLAVLMQHWLLLSSVWGDPRCSLAKACEAIRRSAWLLAAAVDDPARLTAAIEGLGKVLRSTARRNKRKKPSTFELLNNPELLDYFLT